MYALFEGIDTCGKSTQIALLKEKHPEAIVTREPGGTPFGEKAREILLGTRLHSRRAELLLFLADRAEHYEQIIRPNRSGLILSDRGFLSGIGYALANEPESSLEELLELNRFALRGDWPDGIIFFRTDRETLSRRLGTKEPDTIEERGIDYLLEVQGKMEEALEKLSIPTLRLDASGGIEEIHRKICEFLNL